MAALTLGIGAILIVSGIIAYFVTGAVSVTALIPAGIGLLFLIGGLLALRPALRRHAMHACLAIALLGAAGTTMNVLRLGELFAGTAERPAAIIVSTITFVLLVVYLIAGIRSFVRARLLRRDGTAGS